MRLITLLAVTSFFPVLTSAYDYPGCFSAIYSSGGPVVIAIVDNRFFLGNYESEKEKNALGTAKAYGLCIEDYGVEVVKTEPGTKKVLEWRKKNGYSLWRK